MKANKRVTLSLELAFSMIFATWSFAASRQQG
jgi:hypothetical protein